MSIATLVRFLIGDRQAILAIASNRHALWIGLLFVLSAGFAREYDGEYLVREPWHLFIPLGASLASSFLLFLLTSGPLFFRREGRPPFWSTYRSFLTLFWMTAPLAWLYAIPYERFLSAPDSILANLWTLRLVALYRVILMTRVVSVINGISSAGSFFQVMAFADIVALTTVAMLPFPIIAIMGGIHLSESEEIINSATFTVWFFGILTLPIWVIGTLASWAASPPRWQIPGENRIGPPTRSLRALAIGANVIWITALPWTQGEQHRRWQVEHDLKFRRIAQALDSMSARSPADFPPHWDPPPRRVTPPTTPHILDVWEVMAQREAAPWVRQAYLEKLRAFIDSGDFIYATQGLNEFGRLVRVLRDIPEGPDLVAGGGEHFEHLVDRNLLNLSADEREDLKRIVDRAKQRRTPPK